VQTAAVYGANERPYEYVVFMRVTSAFAELSRPAGCPGCVLLLDSTRINVLPLAGRSFHYKPLASSGDYECGELIGEYTLELKNEAAHGIIRDLSIS